MEYQRPYKAPAPRSYKEWCDCLGLVPYPTPENQEIVLDYDDFCFYPNVELRKEREGECYGYWREFGDVWGECRTVEEWLQDFKWEMVEPTVEDMADMNLFLGHDEFWEWSSGKVDMGKRSTLWDDIKGYISRIRNRNKAKE